MGRLTNDHTQYKGSYSKINSNTSSNSSTNSVEVKKIKGCDVYNFLRDLDEPFTLRK